MIARGTILWASLLAGAAGAAVVARDSDTSGTVMTPDEAIESRTVAYATVEFRVGRVGILTGVQGEGMPPHLSPIRLTADARLKDGGEFHVYLNGKLLEDLNRLALEPTECFEGAVIRATGTLAKVEGARAKCDDYQMVVLDLDKLRVTRRRAR